MKVYSYADLYKYSCTINRKYLSGQSIISLNNWIKTCLFDLGIFIPRKKLCLRLELKLSKRKLLIRVLTGVKNLYLKLFYFFIQLKKTSSLNK